ncbi:MAG: hypothetical protein LLG06_15280 [Desulfobacteraceae bacterium]|nr:hypothetical protein [Desulfobacteraceae bacterium]
MTTVGGGRKRTLKPDTGKIRTPDILAERGVGSRNISERRREGVVIRNTESLQDVIPELIREESPELLEGSEWEEGDATEESEEAWDGTGDGNPLKDEDESDMEESEDPPDQLESEDYPATDPDGNPQDIPAVAIIINEFGEVIVPRETYLYESSGYAFTGAGSAIRRGAKRVGLLKIAGKAIVDNNRDLLLDGPEDFSEVCLRRISQISVFEEFTNAPNSSSLVTGNCVKTPLWGVVPLSTFFYPDEWEQTMKEAWKALSVPADLENPMSQNELWNVLARTRPHLLRLQDEDKRMLRLKMHEYGIVKDQGRKLMKRWTDGWIDSRIKAGGLKSIRRREIPAIREEMLTSTLFDKPHASKCREPVYRRFIEERLTAILKSEKFEIV